MIVPLIQLWMKRNNIEQPIVIQYANTADRSVPDAYGGGVVRIWPEDDCTIDTMELARHPNVRRLRKVIGNA